MMKANGFAVVAVIAALVLAGCLAGPQYQGVKGFAKGVITAKGSIWVNGVEYDTSGTQITVNGASGADADLKVGMVVSLKGTIDPATGQGVADQAEYAKSLEGTIDAGSINAAAGTFEIFGVTITVDASTVFEGSTGLSGSSPLADGNRVEVSGVANAAGILASRVEKKTSAGDFELKGTVSGLAAGTFTLTMEGGATVTVNFTGTLDPAVLDGVYVEVEFPSAPSGGALTTTAGKIAPEHGLAPDDGDRVELSGIVTDFLAGPPATFTVEGTSVSADSSLVAGVANGVEVEVQGTLSSGVLQATEVHVDQEADSKLGGPVASANATGDTFMVAGVTVTVDASTIFRDEDWTGHLPVDHFGLADAQAGDHLEVEAYVDGSTVVAVKVERKDPSYPYGAVLRGLATAVSAPNVTVLGAVVDTTPLSFSGGLSGIGDIAAGTTRVKITGTANAGTITWSSVAKAD